jgi:hypothetical protein
MGERKNDMRMRHRQQSRTYFINPNFLFDGLTNRAISVAARIKNLKCVATIGADDLSAPEFGGATPSNIENRLFHGWVGVEFLDKFVAPRPHDGS